MDDELDDKKYPSAKILLDLTYKEYEYESERRKNLETKSGICIALAGTMLSLLLSRMAWGQIPTWDSEWILLQACVAVIAGISFLCTIAFLLVAVNYFTKVLIFVLYQRLDIDEAMNYTSNKEDEFAQFLIPYLCDYIEYNANRNKEKGDNFSKGLKCVRNAIVVMAVFFASRCILAFFST